MDSKLRRRLERIAWNRANATRDDDERWSYLFRTEGGIKFCYYPLSELEGEEFDGELDGLELPWSVERIEEIEDGDDLTEQEMVEWRWAKCRWYADGTDGGWIGWIVPIWIKKEIKGYAAFLAPVGGDDDPSLYGIFDTVEDAKRALSEEGALL